MIKTLNLSKTCPVCLSGGELWIWKDPFVYRWINARVKFVFSFWYFKSQAVPRLPGLILFMMSPGELRAVSCTFGWLDMGRARRLRGSRKLDKASGARINSDPFKTLQRCMVSNIAWSKLLNSPLLCAVRECWMCMNFARIDMTSSDSLPPRVTQWRIIAPRHTRKG